MQISHYVDIFFITATYNKTVVNIFYYIHAIKRVVGTYVDIINYSAKHNKYKNFNFQRKELNKLKTHNRSSVFGPCMIIYVSAQKAN